MKYIKISHTPLYKVVLDNCCDHKKVVLTTRNKDEAQIVLEHYLREKKYYDISLIVENETRYTLDD